MWYRISQQQNFDNLAASSSPSMVYKGASQGIKTDAAGKNVTPLHAGIF